MKQYVVESYETINHCTPNLKPDMRPEFNDVTMH